MATEVNLNAGGWVLLIGFGAIFGAIGQLIRTIGGMKKLNDEARVTGGGIQDTFSMSRLVVSILMGAGAGALATVAMPFDPHETVTTEMIIALIGAGYGGADFIEAFMRKVAPVTPVAATGGIGPKDGAAVAVGAGSAQGAHNAATPGEQVFG